MRKEKKGMHLTCSSGNTFVSAMLSAFKAL